MKTKSFFSDDAIQRIASGNETTQTLISLDMLKKVLKPHEMRNVLGGSDETGGTCGFSGVEKGNGPSEMCWKPICGISKDDAMGWQSYCGGNWCCDSCGQNGYC